MCCLVFQVPCAIRKNLSAKCRLWYIQTSRVGHVIAVCAEPNLTGMRSTLRATDGLHTTQAFQSSFVVCYGCTHQFIQNICVSNLISLKCICGKCDYREIINYQILRYQLIKHSPTLQFPCNVCGKYFEPDLFVNKHEQLD